MFKEGTLRTAMVCIGEPLLVRFTIWDEGDIQIEEIYNTDGTAIHTLSEHLINPNLEEEIADKIRNNETLKSYAHMNLESQIERRIKQ